MSAEHDAVKEFLRCLHEAEIVSLVFNRMSKEEMTRARQDLRAITNSLDHTDVMPWPKE